MQRNWFKNVARRARRRLGERKLVVALLLELSKYDLLREYIGKVQGCILLLVTMPSSDESQAARQGFHAMITMLYKWQRQIISGIYCSVSPQCPSVLVLVKLFENESINLRANAVKLFSCMVESRDEATVLLHVNQKCVETLLKILKSSSDEEEIVSAMGTIRYLPKIEQITQWLLDAGALPIICNCIQEGKDKDLQKIKLVENSVGALCHLTVPTKLEWQKRAAETGIITSLVQLLESGTAPTKQLAALSLTQFSKRSQELLNFILGLTHPHKTGL
ncbi:unnamed protein product [Trifolium pratense]|uniref:Uncharacterized protein n=1 Tax=Trifolium pratense TaxID=57577 RepID=A0ACB0LVB9_TRIPR|nr:unnamed protein product [Trifolium pratense]